MASDRHLACAALITSGVEPEPAMIEAGWPALFASDFAPHVITWLRSADIAVDPPSPRPASKPETVAVQRVEPAPPASAAGKGDSAAAPAPDDVASAAPDGTPSEPAAEAPAAAVIGGEVHESTGEPARPARRTRKH